MIDNADLKKLREANQKRAHEFACANNDITNLGFTAIELAGEIGEVQDAIKKQLRFIKGLKGGLAPLKAEEAISDELGDIIISADRLCDCMKKDLSFNSDYIKVSAKPFIFEYVLSKLTLRLGVYSGRLQESAATAVSLIHHNETPEEFLYFIHKNLGLILMTAAEIAEILHIDLWKATTDKFNKTSEKLGFETTL